MKFCKYCGAQLNDTAQFCSKCGAKQKTEPENNKVAQAELPKTDHKKENKWKRVVGLAILIVVILAVILCFLLVKPRVKDSDDSQEKQFEVQVDINGETIESAEAESTISSEGIDLEFEQNFEASDIAKKILQFNEEVTKLNFNGTFPEKITREWWNEEKYPYFMPEEGTEAYTYNTVLFNGAYMWYLTNELNGVYELS